MAESFSYSELLAKVEAVIEARITGGAVTSYSIAGRSVQKSSMDELMQLRNYYARRAAADETAGGITYADMTGED